MSGPADRLLNLIYEWMREADECSSNLRGLARELESLREDCNAWETVGNTVAVLGSLASIIAAPFTGGGSIVLAGAVAGGIGAGVSVVTKITEGFKSSSKLERVKKIDKRCNEIADEIQDLFHKLRKECPSSSADEKDKHVVNEFLKAMSRRSGLNISLQDLDDLLNAMMGQALTVTKDLANSLIFEAIAVLSLFSLVLGGKLLSAAISRGGKQIGKAVLQGAAELEGKLLSAAVATGAKQVGKSAAVKGASRFLGGVVGLFFSLPEAIDSWTKAIKDKHETAASKSLRDTARAIDEASRNLSNKLKEIQKMLSEAVKSHRPKPPPQPPAPLQPPVYPYLQPPARLQPPVYPYLQPPAPLQPPVNQYFENKNTNPARRVSALLWPLVHPHFENRNTNPARRVSALLRPLVHPHFENRNTNPPSVFQPPKLNSIKTYSPMLRRDSSVSLLQSYSQKTLALRDFPTQLPNHPQKNVTNISQAFGKLTLQNSCRPFTERLTYSASQSSHNNSKQRSSVNIGSSSDGYEDTCKPNWSRPSSQRSRGSAALARPLESIGYCQSSGEEEEEAEEELELRWRMLGEAVKHHRSFNPPQTTNTSETTSWKPSTGSRGKRGGTAAGTGSRGKSGGTAAGTGSRGKSGGTAAGTGSRGKSGGTAAAPSPPDPPGGNDGDSGSETSNESGNSSESTNESSSDEEEKLKMAVLNAHSINKFIEPQGTELIDLIEEQSLDVLMITETWLRQDTSDDAVQSIIPEGFSCINEPRFDGRRGGGVMIVYPSEFICERVRYNGRISTFEYVAATVRRPGSQRSVLVLNIYRPPGKSHDLFIKELRKLLTEVYSNYTNVVIGGDFNIWVDCKENRISRAFEEMLNEEGLVQHVFEITREPRRRNTRRRAGRGIGHILDLVLSRPNVRVSALSVQPNSFSDHKTVLFTVKFPHKIKQLRRAIRPKRKAKTKKVKRKKNNK